MKVELASKNRNTVNICPIINSRYLGSCPNYECPANLIRLTGGRKTGCIHSKYKVSIENFAIIYNVDIKEAQARYSNSISTLERMTRLYTKLQEFRQECKWKNFCHSCGAPLEGNFSACLNIQKCSYRAKLINKQKNRVPFNLPGLNTRKVDIWFFVDRYTKQELRQTYGAYFPETLWSLLPPTLQKGEDITQASKKS